MRKIKKIPAEKNLFKAILLVAIALTVVSQTNLAQASFNRPVNETDPLVSGGTFTVVTNCDSTKNQSQSSIAVNDNRLYALVWQDDHCDGNGNGKGIYVEGSDTQNGPFANIMDNPPGGDRSPIERVNDTLAGDQKDPSIAMDHSGNFVVAWDDGTNDVQNKIYVRAFETVYNTDGSVFGFHALGSSILVNTNNSGVQDHPKVAMDFGAGPNAGDFIVTWHGAGDGGTGTGGDEGIYMQRYTANFSCNTKTVTDPSDTRLTHSGNACTPSNPTTVGNNILVNSFTDGAQVDPAVAINNMGQALITWSGPGTTLPSSDEVWMQVYGNDNTATGSNVRVNSTSPANKPSIAADKSTEPSINVVPGGKFVIVYKAGSENNQQIYGRLVGLVDGCPGGNCTTSGVELNINNNTSSDLPAVSMDYLGNFTVTWQQDDGSPNGNINIRAVNYDYLGHRIDTNSRINENTFFDADANQSNPAIAKDKDGEYLITWTSPQSPTNLDVRYRILGTEIFKEGPEVLANSPTTNESQTTGQYNAYNAFSEWGTTTAMASNGNHVVAWVGLDVNNIQRIFYNLYDAGGNIILKNGIADTVNDSSVGTPEVSFFKDTTGTGLDRFIIAWIGNDPANLPPSGQQQIMYREFNADGTPDNSIVSNELPVTAATNSLFNTLRISVGYYKNDSSIVIDRFAVIYNQVNNDGTAAVLGAYHNNSSFTPETLQAADLSCAQQCGNVDLDLYPDPNGNPNIVYTWDYGSPLNTWAQEAKGGSLIGTPFQINDSGTVASGQPSIAFVAENQYVITWTKCDDANCQFPSIYLKRFDGQGFTDTNGTCIPDFNNGTQCQDIIAYPGGGPEQLANSSPIIAADTNDGSFLIIWNKYFNDTGIPEVDGKFFNTSTILSNFGVGFIINTTQGGAAYPSDVDMNNNGQTIIGWKGMHNDIGGNTIDDNGSVFQLLNLAPTESALPNLPTITELSITSGGKTLAMPSQIQFPAITASTTTSGTVTREIDENPVTGQPPYFQLEDLGGNASSVNPPHCDSTPCYSVSISASDFTFTDNNTGQTYTIPSANVSVKNYDGNHPGVGIGTCGTDPGADLLVLSGSPADFSLDSSTCDWLSLNTQRTILNKVMNNSDTAKVQWFPEMQVTVPALTPPGTYAGTITITSA